MSSRHDGDARRGSGTTWSGTGSSTRGQGPSLHGSSPQFFRREPHAPPPARDAGPLDWRHMAPLEMDTSAPPGPPHHPPSTSHSPSPSASQQAHAGFPWGAGIAPRHEVSRSSFNSQHPATNEQQHLRRSSPGWNQGAPDPLQGWYTSATPSPQGRSSYSQKLPRPSGEEGNFNVGPTAENAELPVPPDLVQMESEQYSGNASPHAAGGSLQAGTHWGSPQLGPTRRGTEADSDSLLPPDLVGAEGYSPRPPPASWQPPTRLDKLVSAVYRYFCGRGFSCILAQVL